MPKDPTRNIESYKIRGGQINQYDYVRNQNELSQEQQPVNPEQGNPLPFPAEQQQMERVRQLLAKHGETVPGQETPASDEQKPESPDVEAPKTLESQSPVTTRGAEAQQSEDASPAPKTARRAAKKSSVKSAAAPKKQGAKKRGAARTAAKKVSSSKKASSSKSIAKVGKGSVASRSPTAGVKKSVRTAEKTVASPKATKKAPARSSSAKTAKGKKTAAKKRSSKAAVK